MQDQVDAAAKKATNAANKAVRATNEALPDVTAETDFSIDGLFASFKSMIASFDQSPLTFIKENPMRATVGGFVLGLIFGAAMSKRSVTK